MQQLNSGLLFFALLRLVQLFLGMCLLEWWSVLPQTSALRDRSYRSRSTRSRGNGKIRNEDDSEALQHQPGHGLWRRWWRLLQP